MRFGCDDLAALRRFLSLVVAKITSASLVNRMALVFVIANYSSYRSFENRVCTLYALEYLSS